MATVYVNEILEKIDKETDEAKKIDFIKFYADKHPYNMIFSLNCNELIKLDVPEGPPPYKRDETVHADFLQTDLSREIKRLVSIIKGRNNLKRLQREGIFIQVLEAISPKEADVLIFAKDKALHELYPSLTMELFQKAVPQYCNKLSGD